MDCVVHGVKKVVHYWTIVISLHLLQYSGLENSMDCIVNGGTKSQTGLGDFHFQASLKLGSPVSQHLESQFGQGPRQCIHPVGETSKTAVQKFPLIIPGQRQTDIIINLWPNYKPGFLLMLFVLLCKTWNVAPPGSWLVRHPPGA